MEQKIQKEFESNIETIINNIRGKKVLSVDEHESITTYLDWLKNNVWKVFEYHKIKRI